MDSITLLWGRKGSVRPPQAWSIPARLSVHPSPSPQLVLPAITWLNTYRSQITDCSSMLFTILDHFSLITKHDKLALLKFECSVEHWGQEPTWLFHFLVVSMWDLNPGSQTPAPMGSLTVLCCLYRVPSKLRCLSHHQSGRSFRCTRNSEVFLKPNFDSEGNFKKPVSNEIKILNKWFLVFSWSVTSRCK